MISDFDALEIFEKLARLQTSLLSNLHYGVLTRADCITHTHTRTCKVYLAETTSEFRVNIYL